jgi:dienelactone hydrolase
LPTAELRFDIGRLVKRLVSVADWLARYPETCRLGIGLCGASTGAAAALAAAAERPQSVAASVETS